MLINLLNVIYFNYHAEKITDNDDEYINYFKKHLILSNRLISEICTFSKTKSDNKIKDMTFEKIKDYEKIPANGTFK